MKSTTACIACVLGIASQSLAIPSAVNGIAPPSGYTRLEDRADTYSHWVSHLPLKSDTTIHTFDGRSIPDDYYQTLAVVDLPLLFKQDLEQCADFCFRFWAEYHKSQGKLDRLYLFDYNGRRQFLAQSNLSFAAFLKRTMANANSYSIKKGCLTIDSTGLVPGDMIVQNENGGIGHVSVIMDVAVSAKGEKVYLIGFSFMPAQEFHIEKADPNHGRDGWFTLQGFYAYLREFLDLGAPVLRRFATP